MTAQEALQLGNRLKSAGRLPEAAAAFRQAAELSPPSAEAVTLLGLTLGQMGDTRQAIAAFEQAVRLRPDLAETHSNLSNALREAGQWGPAIISARKAIELRPNLAGAYSNLGNAMHGIGDFENAAAAYRKAIELAPDSVAFLNNLAVALRELKRLDESIEFCREAIQLQPNDPQGYNNLGNALHIKGELDAAEAAYRHSLTLRPGQTATLTDLGNVHYFRGEFDRAMDLHRQVLKVEPNNPLAHWSLALMLLTRGEYEEGWKHYEWRWRVRELRLRLRTDAPRWDGGDLKGRTILLHNEQGFGDTIQFVRYVPLVAARGGKIVLACPRDLFGLMRQLPHLERCVPHDEPAPSCDLCCPLLSLPALLGTRADNIPSSPAYLSAPAELAERWKERLKDDRRKKIGLAWAGRPDHANDRNRSMPLEKLATLAQFKDVHWISLQKGAAREQVKTVPMPISDWTDELKDFSGTAGLIANLDLVICVDTAVAHLAGAMGRPVWMLLPMVPDWRWMLHRADSPWYPSMRLFRQERIGEWEKPVGQIVEALRST